MDIDPDFEHDGCDKHVGDRNNHKSSNPHV